VYGTTVLTLTPRSKSYNFPLVYLSRWFVGLRLLTPAFVTCITYNKYWGMRLGFAGRCERSTFINIIVASSASWSATHQKQDA